MRMAPPAATIHGMPHESATAVEVFANLQSFFAFLAFVVPGFLSLRAYDVVRGGDARKINEAFVDVIIYSFATDLIWTPALLIVLGWTPSVGRTIALTAIGLCGFVFTPIALGTGWFCWQTRLAKRGVIADPQRKPWDVFFYTASREKLDLAVLLTLPDGRKLGGRYRASSFASHYPADEQLHVGETWIVDQQTGAFLAPVAGSKGFIVDKKDLLSVEFIEWNAMSLASKPAERPV